MNIDDIKQAISGLMDAQKHALADWLNDNGYGAKGSSSDSAKGSVSDK